MKSQGKHGVWKQLRESGEDDEVCKIARAWTLTGLPRLDNVVAYCGSTKSRTARL